jgi:hypothetical protein
MAKAPWDIGTTGNFAGDLLRMGGCFDPATLTVAATVATVGSSVLSGLGQMQAGKAANANAQFQAKQMEQQAGQERAASQRDAIAERRRADIMQSNAQAAAAASGGGATDPTVLNITGNLAKEGEYNALSALFSGEERARGMELQASSTRMMGKQAKKQGMVGGISTIIGGAASAASKYSPAPASGTVGTAGLGGTRAPWQQPGSINPYGGRYA